MTPSEAAAAPLTELLGNILVASKRLRISNEEEVHSVAHLLYEPHPGLPALLHELDQLTASSKKTASARRGQLLEHIVYLAFSGLKGVTECSSYRSATSQLDLFISGDDELWKFLCEILHVDFTKRGFVIEAKAWNKPIGDAEFRRLCALVEWHFPKTAGLGVMVSLSGASGFPSRSETSLALRDARLTQVLFQSRVGTSVVVLNRSDLDQLVKPGGLVELLRRRIVDIDRMAPKLDNPGQPTTDKQLPEHLAKPWS